MSRFSLQLSSAAVLGFLCAIGKSTSAQSVIIDSSSEGRQQVIDGFGTCLDGTEGQTQWFQDLYFEDMQCSMLRFDITPKFREPYSDILYNSPPYGQPGVDGNFVRSYKNATGYKRNWNGKSAQIAVMGPDIDKNVEYFDYNDCIPKTAGILAQIGKAKKSKLGDFKLFASIWSPAPWLKLSSGNNYGKSSANMPVQGTPWPFIWLGNFAGGVLDVSGTPLSAFDDSMLGGTGPTSALTQFARGLAAYLHGFQRQYDVRLYAISIQNELNFEEFYNSASYPLSAQYIAALKAARTELDKYDDLKNISIEGPEDLLGGDVWGMWQLGDSSKPTHKNLQYLSSVAADPMASSALAFFSIHGYAADGVNSEGADPTTWNYWVNGWTSAPAHGLASAVNGFASYRKKSWMTETSGESADWIVPTAGFPNNGAFSIALKIHQALTAGRESAWIYWQMTDGKGVGESTLTDRILLATSAKYTAAKHFFRFIRPGAQRVNAIVSPASTINASAYVDDSTGTLTIVLVNTGASGLTANVQVPNNPSNITLLNAYTSKKDSLWRQSAICVSAKQAAVEVPGYGVVTLVGNGIQVKGGDSVSESPRKEHSNSGGAASGRVAAIRRARGCGCGIGLTSRWVLVGSVAAIILIACRGCRRR